MDTSQQIACSTEVNPTSVDAIRNEILRLRIKGLEQVIQGLQEAIDKLEDELYDALKRSGCDSD